VFYQEDEAILASHSKRVTREQLQKQAKAATEKAVPYYERQQQQVQPVAATSRKTTKSKPKAVKRNGKAPSRLAESAANFVAATTTSASPAEAPAASSDTSVQPSPSRTQGEQMEKHVITYIGNWLTQKAMGGGSVCPRHHRACRPIQRGTRLARTLSPLLSLTSRPLLKRRPPLPSHSRLQRP
ncbi:hypothetical protein MTO96_044747, partial [Rhipicephalus appendiculatus]